MSDAGPREGRSCPDEVSKLGAAIAETARRDPERVALDDGTAALSYAELSERLAGAEPTEAGARRAIRLESRTADVEAVLAATFGGASLLLLDAKTTDWERERSEGLFVAAGGEGPGRPVLGLCSSGSSGLPKVVELDWAGLIDNAAAFADTAGFDGDDVLWCTTRSPTSTPSVSASSAGC